MSNTQSNQRTWASPTNIGLCLFIAVAAFFLWMEHRAHLFGILPYLILLACPFIHLFMHRGHGGHGRGGREREAGGAHRHGDTS